jgi:DNA-binding CsgD family transcriptional regulator
MTLFESDFFTVNYQEGNNLLVSTWSGKALNSDVFIKSLNSYMEVLGKSRAERVIWDHSNFSFQIPEKLYPWIEAEVNLPAKKLGMKKIGFIIGQDVMAQFSTMDTFEATNSVFAPSYFSNPNKAFDWIKTNSPIDTNPFEKEISFFIEKNADKGKAKISLEMDLEKLPFYLKVLKQYFGDHSFISKNYVRYMRLSVREKEILNLIVNGANSNKISEILFISVNTVTTHRKNIVRKLGCKNVAELARFSLLVNL